MALRQPLRARNARPCAALRRTYALARRVVQPVGRALVRSRAEVRSQWQLLSGHGWAHLRLRCDRAAYRSELTVGGSRASLGIGAVSQWAARTASRLAPAELQRSNPGAGPGECGAAADD